MLELIQKPWPWYVTGPLIGLLVPLLLLVGNKKFGISSTLRQVCSAAMPGRIAFFRDYNWKNDAWNLFFAAGIILGGFIASAVLNGGGAVAISDATVADLKELGITDFSSFIPLEIFSWDNLATGQGLLFMVFGGFLVGFGARYGGGCTSGHAIMGLSYLQFASLVAVISFFVGGLLMTHVIFPLIF